MKARNTGTLSITLSVLAMLITAGWTLVGDDDESAKLTPGSPSQTVAANSNLQVYAVGKRVLEFPTNEDLSTPEAAYATLNRLLASGDQGSWGRLSASRLADKLGKASGTHAVSASERARFLRAEIVEVHLWDDKSAVVIARMPKDMDLRWLSCEGGRWLNDGNDGAPDLEAARARITQVRAYRQAKRLRNSRPPIADPEKYLRPFVEFLRRESADPQEFILKALGEHRLVILGEVHNRQRYWAFNSALVRTPAFAKHVGVIYLELPSNDQPLMDTFLAAPKYDPAPVIEILRDMFEFGWPDRATLEFCQAVWEANEGLPRDQQLRIVLADKARPWKKIQNRTDWTKYNVDRNKFMAEEITRDLREHAQDSRHALFIVGYMHATRNLTGPDGEPLKSAGWRLCQALGGSNVFVIFPHSPVISDRGEVDGRLGLGLFDTAFASVSNRPVAFPLDHGPFGELLFDASLDLITADPYRAGFDAFLYLGPLEDELVSPLIPGFYTDEYAREVDRRCRLMNGRGLESNPDIGAVSGEAIRRLREAWWGQPRYDWQALGPLNAWHYGSDWEKKLREAKQRNALKDSAAIKQAAQRLFDAIRNADYEQPGDWRRFPAPDADYTVYSDYPGWMRWVCQHFATNPIVKVELGEVALNSKQMPELSYTLTLQNGQTLEGTLPFRWNARSQRWGGVQGLDWHRR